MIHDIGRLDTRAYALIVIGQRLVRRIPNSLVIIYRQRGMINGQGLNYYFHAPVHTLVGCE